MCAKRREDRLASPKEVIDAFVRLGYAAPSTEGGTEFAAEMDAASEGMVQDILPDPATTPRVKENLILETQDKDVQEFLARLRRKRLRKKLILGGSVCLFLLIVALVWRLLA